jgi:hypothetical protein
LLAAGEDAENQADSEFDAAIKTAAEQGAKLPELRARVARAKLQVAHGGRQQARDMVLPIYDWFSEGWETRDLVEARTLLANIE